MRRNTNNSIIYDKKGSGVNRRGEFTSTYKGRGNNGYTIVSNVVVNGKWIR